MNAKILFILYPYKWYGYSAVIWDKVTSNMINKPIAYDFHGDASLCKPFTEIKPEDIHIYLDVDTHVGSKTCGQACQHCWFVNYGHIKQLKFLDDEGVFISQYLKSEGYQVYPRYTDSFAYDGDRKSVV